MGTQPLTPCERKVAIHRAIDNLTATQIVTSLEAAGTPVTNEHTVGYLREVLRDKVVAGEISADEVLAISTLSNLSACCGSCAS